MNYITVLPDNAIDPERVIAVVTEKEAERVLEELRTLRLGHVDRTERVEYRIRTVHQIVDDNIEIPPDMQWIVASDLKFMKREAENRLKNLTNENSLSPKKL